MGFNLHFPRDLLDPASLLATPGFVNLPTLRCIWSSGRWERVAGMTKAAEVSIEFGLFLEIDGVFASVR
jgi:hypothetical protein